MKKYEKGNWCKRCDKFVEIKKSYKHTMICGIIYLIAIVIGLLAWFPMGAGIAALAVPLVLLLCTQGAIIEVLFYNPVCIICGKSTIRKKRKKKITGKKKQIIENSKKIVDYLKTDNSGNSQLRLASVLQIDHTKIKKSLNYLERLGVIEKKKVSAEEMLFFYKED